MNTFTTTSMVARELGARYVHSVFGRGVVVKCEKVGIGFRLTVRKD